MIGVGFVGCNEIHLGWKVGQRSFEWVCVKGNQSAGITLSQHVMEKNISPLFIDVIWIASSS